ncbi:major facilitator superfamily domain-containing protein 12 isoform X1 [Octopus sinensis]|uniref:Major facilitator superfamily domain-containing protein 12 isoform X1 n=1 Tax=Octopus sinensis TaxID=2607531 RepID=A0A6P7U2A9_9MOLL|nr:major facilitator superfamily domain-containing protein 12 isoform X1 [Octopus sinensis]
MATEKETSINPVANGHSTNTNDQTQESSVPFIRKLAFGCGHVFNDLAASMWFSYLLIYFNKVLNFNSVLAGYLMLAGQICDGLSTTFVGIESDRINGCCFLGKRKSWHLVGTFCVLLSFPFIFNPCITCDNEPDSIQLIYYISFILVFQFGWANVQISHLSLIPELTKNKHERVSLNSIRYAFTVLSNLAVYIIFWIIFNMNVGEKLGRKDSGKFELLVFIVTGIGVFFSFTFHILSPEKMYSTPVAAENKEQEGLLSCTQSIMTWKDWWYEPQFYMIAVIYMATRLFLNISQIYLPLYVLDTIQLNKKYIAIVPLVVYIFSFLTTLIMKMVNSTIGAKMTFVIGLIISLSFSIWILFIPINSMQVFGAAAFNGIGGSVILITSLSLTTELIATNTESAAFVYGSLSLVDKCANGIAVVVIQHLLAMNTGNCCGDCLCDNRLILFVVPGGAATIGFIFLCLLGPQKIGVRKRTKLYVPYTQNTPTESSNPINNQQPNV